MQVVAAVTQFLGYLVFGLLALGGLYLLTQKILKP